MEDAQRRQLPQLLRNQDLLEKGNNGSERGRMNRKEPGSLFQAESQIHTFSEGGNLSFPAPSASLLPLHNPSLTAFRRAAPTPDRI